MNIEGYSICDINNSLIVKSPGEGIPDSLVIEFNCEDQIWLWYFRNAQWRWNHKKTLLGLSQAGYEQNQQMQENHFTSQISLV